MRKYLRISSIISQNRLYNLFVLDFHYNVHFSKSIWRMKAYPRTTLSSCFGVWNLNIYDKSFFLIKNKFVLSLVCFALTQNAKKSEKELHIFCICRAMPRIHISASESAMRGWFFWINTFAKAKWVSDSSDMNIWRRIQSNNVRTPT